MSINTANKIATKQIKKVKKVNFKQLLREVVLNDETYDKEETVAFLRNLMVPILKTGITMTLNMDAVEAIKAELKGNMALHLGSITLEEVMFPVTLAGEVKKMRNDFVDYGSIFTSLYDLLLPAEEAVSTIVIKEHLSDEGLPVTSTQWAYFKNVYMKKYHSKYTLVLEDGTSRKSAKWLLVKTSSLKKKAKPSKSQK